MTKRRSGIVLIFFSFICLSYWKSVAASSEAENQYQLQLLQQEVRELRGLIENIDYQLKKQKSIGDDRYLELDSRLQSILYEHDSSLGKEKAGESAVIDLPDFDQSGEKDLYETAQLLIRNKQFDRAIEQLRSFIQSFPDSQLLANAYYWLGLVYADKIDPDLEQARQALAQVMAYFPDHAKVPDAAYALGKVHHALGNCETAKSLLGQVVDQYPDKSASKLSENYLRESVDCSGP